MARAIARRWGRLSAGAARSAEKLLERLGSYPTVALIGPRQSGKTTLERSLGGAYYDLEQESDRLRLDLEWHDRLGGADLFILDEAQAWPDAFPRLGGAIDRERKRPGRFLLLGSVSPSLMVQVSESLAASVPDRADPRPVQWQQDGRSAERTQKKVALEA